VLSCFDMEVKLRFLAPPEMFASSAFCFPFRVLQMACCGSEGLFPGGGDCMSVRYASAKVAPVDSWDQSSYGSVRKKASSHSQHGDLQLKSSSSHEGGSNATSASHRKRPLALAAGYKYAEDMNGRPIVITPGNRRAPMLRGNRSSPTSSKDSQPMHHTIDPIREVTPNALFLVDLDKDRHRHVSYKPASHSS
jgi:hypothetical protein